MHVKFINKLTGTVMYVDEQRADEYAAAGHKLAAVSPVTKTKKPKKKPGGAK